MEAYRRQIRAVLENVQIDFPKSFSWFGVRYECSPQGIARLLNEEQQASFLLLGLEDHLYRNFYCTGGISYQSLRWDFAGNGSDIGRFIGRLSEANLGAGLWDPGWRVCSLGSSAVGLMKEGLRIYVPPQNCLAYQGGQLKKGGTAALRHPKESFKRSPGFYMVYGEEPLELATGHRIVRLYWNLMSTGAEKFVRAVTRRLNPAGIPFVLKVLDDPGRYTRCDSGIIYIGKASYAQLCADHLGEIYGRVVQDLAPGEPALTKRIAPGASVAEDPAGHRSFGSDRCSVLAKAMVAVSLRRMSLSERVDCVEEEFRRSGIDPARPYLNPGSSDDYDPVEISRSYIASATASRQWPREPSVERYVNAAQEIGALIVRSAVWYNDQCNWVGALGPASEASQVPRFGSLGTDFYDGTTGIAFFLGQLFSVTGDQKVRQTALGAIKHALANCNNNPREQFGLYVGVLGTALVAARLGLVLDRKDLLRQGQTLSKIPPPAEIGFDLMSGAAGRVIGCVSLHQLFREDVFLEAAYAMGNLLVASAISSRNGVSWSSDHVPGRRSLTGFSHGTAGAAYALLELFALFGGDKFRSTAEAAFDYERSCFDPREGNWPDFRRLDHAADDRLIRLPCSTTWCHGAPGIAISRIRAADRLPGRSYLGEALVALDTTRDHLRQWLRSGRANYSLCHGVAGNADVLLSAVRSGVPVGFGTEELINETAELGLRTYGDAHSLWPCGVGGGGANPSLMLGWAGIGHFYLRLACKNIPTPLAPRELGVETGVTVPRDKGAGGAGRRRRP